MPDAPILVLGHFPAYIDLAAALYGRVFAIPADDYARLSAEARWMANRAFIDDAIAAGCRIVFGDIAGVDASWECLRA